MFVSSGICSDKDWEELEMAAIPAGVHILVKSCWISLEKLSCPGMFEPGCGANVEGPAFDILESGATDGKGSDVANPTSFADLWEDCS
jgi:hypothetical protein